jgi:hypothetical protein
MGYQTATRAAAGAIIVPVSADIIDDCLRLVREGQPQMSGDALWHMECKLRNRFGGKSYYVPKRAAYGPRRRDRGADVSTR